MTDIRYNFGQIHDVSGAVASFTSSMDAELQALYTQFTQLFAQDWEGAAGQAVDEARRKWNEGAAEIKLALSQVGVKLGTAADRMNAVDKQIAAGI